MRMPSAVAVLVALALALAAGPVAAQSAEEKQAFGLFRDGRQAMDDGHFDAALDLFRRAYKIFPIPQIRLREAECLDRMGDLEGALEVFQAIRSDDPKVADKVAEEMQDLKTRMERPVEVVIRPDVPGVDVTVDHVEQHRAPVTLKLARGVHHFEFKKPGYRTVVEERAIRGAGPQTYAVTLPEATGNVVLRTDAGSFDGVVVRIDDREFQPSDAPGTPGRTDPIPVPAGRRSLLCVKQGRPPYMATVNVPADGVIEVPCDLGGPAVAARTGRASPWKWVTFSTGTAVAVAGAGLTGWYFGSRGAGKVVKGTDYHEGWIGVGMMGVGVAAAVTSFFLFRDRPPASAAAPGAPRTAVLAAAPVPGGGLATFAVGF